MRVLTLTMRVREIPPDHKGGYDLAVESLVEQAETYEAACRAAEARVPEGWQPIWVIVDG